MTASLKLKVVKKSRNRLFYSKFLYKATIQYVGINLAFTSKSITKFIEKVERRRTFPPTYFSKNYLTLDDCDLNRIETFINFFVKYKNSKEVTFLTDYGAIAIHTNNVDILNELGEIDSLIIVTEAVPPPADTLYFVKEPEFEYRVYLKGIRASLDLISTLSDFEKTYENSSDISYSLGLKNFCSSSQSTTNGKYLASNFYIDYNNYSNLIFMYLIFSNCLGKNYKLEKKPE